MSDGRSRRIIVLGVAALAVPLLLALVGFAARSPLPAPWLEPARPGTTCVLPRADMRYQHMTHLKALRDRVVRTGDRSGQPQGITSCRGCHAHREQFCDRCHEQAGVTPDCFGCHSY
jgi:uncharacterized paraquat-inducible protein A